MVVGVAPMSMVVMVIIEEAVVAGGEVRTLGPGQAVSGVPELVAMPAMM